MSTSIFDAVAGWSFTQNDDKAKIKLSELRIQAAKQLPPEHKSNLIVLLFDEIKKTKLYSALKTLPKGVIHHLHFDCCQDQEFYSKYVITDPIIYLGKNLDCFHLGTQQQAQKNSWVSMLKARENFPCEQAFVKHVSNLTMLNKKQLSQNFTHSQDECWERFQAKISNFFPILGAVHLFKKYSIHILSKFIKNGYDRIQFRSLLTRLKEYNLKGQVIKEHDQTKFMQVFDQAYQIVKKQHPQLTVGFIFFGLKMLPPLQNEQLLTNVLDKNWQKTIGIDFVQQQDSYGCQIPYDQIATRVLQKFPNKNIKKVYHGGQTKNHLNRNLEVIINSGSARIGHGINILQHPDLIEVCRQKQICFQKNPVSNIILSYIRDPRTATGPLLLGLGIPITINPDDPGKFGLEDNTMDYFVTFISSNWSLKHLKLIGLHSINHSICSQQVKQNLHKTFTKRWDEWVNDFLSQ